MKPKISVILCTYNGENLIKSCLNSILSQNYKNFEVICVDGMSSDNTQEIIKDYQRKDKRIKLIINKNRLPEGAGNGKWLGFKKSRGKIIGMIDQDNILQKKDLFENVTKIIGKEKDIVGILGGSKHDKSDKPIVRYVSLFGTDSFFAYRSIDFLRNLKNQSGKYETFILEEDNMPLTGGNCFFYKKEDLSKIGGYTQDVVGIQKLLKKSKNKLIVIKDATKHYAEKSLFSLAKKKFMWGRKYFVRKEEGFDYMPKTKKEAFAFTKNFVFNILIIPNLFPSFAVYIESKDPVAFLFPVMAFFNTLAYGLNFIRQKLNI